MHKYFLTLFGIGVTWRCAAQHSSTESQRNPIEPLIHPTGAIPMYVTPDQITGYSKAGFET
ncbi:MAG: hypothetical protein ACM36B_10255, partial [Bacteroidota bacterium]